MNAVDQYVANEFFKKRILLFDGYSFEQFFTEIMVLCYPDFKQVKPQGRLGDKSCDGFSLKEGLYCQVYAPEDLSKNDEESAKKLEHDFTNLVAYWQSKGFIIRQFRYVINDKYKGAGPTTHTRIQSICQKYPQIDIKLWTASNVEELFETLTPTDKNRVIGFVPTPSIALCENSALNEVTCHLMTVQQSPTISSIPMSLNMVHKIQFNHLNTDAENFLRYGLMHYGQVEDFFNNNNFGQREILREKFNGLYCEAQQEIPDADNHPNEVFIYIYEKACPTPLTTANDIAVRALMAYYFEACDIFKIPEQDDTTV